MLGSRTRLLLAIVIACALSLSFAMHLPQASAEPDGRAGMAVQSSACHDQPEPSVPPSAKFQACCVVCYSNVPMAPLQARAIAFADQPFAADAPSQPAG